MGAGVRYLACAWIATAAGSTGYAWATFAVNIIGSFCIGWLSPFWLSMHHPARIFMIVGVLGGFTTFSSFSSDMLHLLQDGEGNIVDSDLPPDKFARMVEQHFGGDLELVVRLYFGRSMRMAELGGFDIVGHADKVHYNAEYCSPGVTREAWYKRLVYDYLSLIVSKGYLVEVNTKAFCTSGVFFPGEQYFGILHDLDARVVVNSDSHYPDLISSGRAEALEKLRRAGFRMWLYAA